MRFPFDDATQPLDDGRPPEHRPPGARAARPGRARRPWAFGCGVAAGALLVPCLLMLWCGGFLVIQAAGANSALSTFCGHLRARRYSEAYATFSARLKADVGEERFTRANLDLDAADGAVRECRAAGNRISISNSASELPLVLVRARTYTGTVRLIQEGGAWRIDALDPALQLTG